MIPALTGARSWLTSVTSGPSRSLTPECSRHRGKPICVLIADDHESSACGIGRLIDNRPDIEVVGLARDGAEAIPLCSEHAPDVVPWTS